MERAGPCLAAAAPEGETGAGVQFAVEPEGETEAELKKGPVSNGAKASKSGAKAASTSASGKRRPRKSPRRQTRKTLPPAAE